MKPNPPAKPSQRIGWSSILGYGVFVLILIGLPVLAYFAYDHPLILMVLTCFYVITAFWMRSRVIVCAMIGIVLGLLFDDGVRSGSRETQLLQLAARLAACLIIGLVAGLAWEHSIDQDDQPERRRPKKRR